FGMRRGLRYMSTYTRAGPIRRLIGVLLFVGLLIATRPWTRRPSAGSSCPPQPPPRVPNIIQLWRAVALVSLSVVLLVTGVLQYSLTDLPAPEAPTPPASAARLRLGTLDGDVYQVAVGYQLQIQLDLRPLEFAIVAITLRAVPGLQSQLPGNFVLRWPGRA